MNASVARRVFLQVRGGPMAFRRAVLAPGDRVRVGRTSLADFAIAGDEHLSQLHWEIAWDGTTCEVQDLGGAGGMLVGGEPRARAVIRRSGTWIRAGQTDFLVFFEDVGQMAPAASTAGWGAVEGAFALLCEVAKRRALFAVLDAARSDRVVSLLRTAVDEHDSLYQGLRAETMEDGAPYLVRFAEDSRLLRQLVFEGWGRSWGSYLESKASLKELRDHFRRIVMVSREKDGLPMYFRFYDPRVLRVFLPIATARQVELVFGSVERFFAEVPGGEGVRSFGRGAPGIVETQDNPELPEQRVTRLVEERRAEDQ